jgi:hypothetical protein
LLFFFAAGILAMMFASAQLLPWSRHCFLYLSFLALLLDLAFFQVVAD